MEKNNLTINDLFEALFVAGGDCELIETRESAEFALQFIKDSEELEEILPGGDEWEWKCICEMLDISEANNPKRVYKIRDGHRAEIGYIAFKKDWEYA